MTPEDRTVLERLFPIAPAPYTIRQGGNVGLVIVDPGQGLTRFGNLADPAHMVPMVGRIAAEYRRLKAQLGDRLQVLIFLDEHEWDIPEPPYPPHCIVGTGEDLLDPDLGFMLLDPNVGVIYKDCINGFPGSMLPVREVVPGTLLWTNEFVDWVIKNQITTLVFVGDCTDICVSDLVVASLSARNHGMFTPIGSDDNRAAYVAAITSMDLVVLEKACETFDAPAIGHDREAWHHIGLATMASRGAVLADRIVVD